MLPKDTNGETYSSCPSVKTPPRVIGNVAYPPTLKLSSKGNGERNSIRKRITAPFKGLVIKCPIWPFSVAYAEGGDDSKLYKLVIDGGIMTKGLDWPPMSSAEHQGGMLTRYFGPHALIWMPDKITPKSLWRQFLSHECLHAVNNALTNIGLGIDIDVMDHPNLSLDEPFTYTHDWLCKELKVFD